ncbi:hypothetical protein B0H19DRAFT_1172493 [Mycena capillaripes]|nr:hypothetical protein B0H19DRAFT_1172493 [Mycena capillaripes]
MTQNHHSNENTRLLSSASPPPIVNHGTRPSAGSSSSGASTMTTVRSLFQLAHGVGENVRGTLLGAIDSWENNGEQKHHDVARQGRAEIDQAFQQLWGTGGSQPAQIPASMFDCHGARNPRSRLSFPFRCADDRL